MRIFALYGRILGVYTGKRNGGTVVKFRFNCTVASANGKAAVAPGAEKSRQLYSNWHQGDLDRQAIP